MLTEGRARLILDTVQQVRELFGENPIVVWSVIETGYAVLMVVKTETKWNGDRWHFVHTPHLKLWDLATNSPPNNSIELGRVRVKVGSKEAQLACKAPGVEDYELPSGKYKYADGEFIRVLGKADLASASGFQRAMTEFEKEVMLFLAMYSNEDELVQERLGQLTSDDVGRFEVNNAMVEVRDNGI